MEQEKEVVLLIADISGYTRFMLNNARTLVHAQTVITALMNAVINEAEVPLKIAKLEGDAVFLYVAAGRRWAEDKAAVRQKLAGLHRAFTRRLAELQATNTCDCQACLHIQALTIKFVVHAGKALFYRIGGLSELAGPDVIIVHRLLKNEIQGNEYLLLTRAAFDALGFDAEGFQPAVEHYDDVGDIPVMVRTDLKAWAFTPDTDFHKRHGSFLGRLAGKGSRLAAMLKSRQLTFNHLD